MTFFLMAAPYLESIRLYYRPLSISHLTQNYVDWMNDPDVYRYLETGGNYSKQDLRDYLERVEKREDLLFWAIHLKENDKHIGNIKIDPVHNRHKLGEYGIMMGDKSEWGRGYAKESTERILQFCFEELGLRKITLGVVAENTAAVALYRKIGFTVEGVLRKHGVYNGRYCDTLTMSIFNPNFV